jgi:hypothetical protein
MASFRVISMLYYRLVIIMARLKGQWGLGKGITEAKSYSRRNSAERRLRI